MRLNINNQALCTLLNIYGKKFKIKDYWEVDSKGTLWLNEYDPNTGERNFIKATKDDIYFWLMGIVGE